MTREIYAIEQSETTAIISQSHIEAVRRKKISSTGVRLYDKGCIGVAGGLGDVEIHELERSARQALEREIPYDGEPTGTVERHETSDTSLLPLEDEFIPLIETILDHLRTNHPEMSFFNVARRSTRAIALKNDRGADLSDVSDIAEIGIIFKEKSSANILDGAVAVEGRRFKPAEYLHFADSILEAHGTPLDLPSGRVPVAFTTSDTLPLLKFAEDLHGLRFGSGGSSLSGKRGERLFSNQFSLYQSRRQDESLGPFFDAEGTVQPDDRYALIDRGVIKTPYTDKKTARRFDLPVTGAAAADYDDVPHLSFPGFAFGTGARTARELLDGRTAILVIIASGGDFTPSGEFGTPVQLAYLYDGERMLGRLPEFKLTGNLYAMYGDDFIGLSSDTLHPASRDHLLIMEMELG